MVEVARAGQTMTYKALTNEITALRYQPRSKALSQLLCEISSSENEAGRGLTSVVVVTVRAPHMPGEGFFDFASGLGRDASDRRKCFEK